MAQTTTTEEGRVIRESALDCSISGAAAAMAGLEGGAAVIHGAPGCGWAARWAGVGGARRGSEKRAGLLTGGRLLVGPFVGTDGSGGYFFFERGFLSYLSTDEGTVLEREPLVQLARDGELSIHKHPGFWACMDTQRDRDYLNGLWESGDAPWVP